MRTLDAQIIEGSTEEWRAIGEILSARREKAGLTMQEVADRSGLSVQYVRDMELGRTTGNRRRISAALQYLAAVLGIDLDLITPQHLRMYFKLAENMPTERQWQRARTHAIQRRDFVLRRRSAERAGLELVTEDPVDLPLHAPLEVVAWGRDAVCAPPDLCEFFAACVKHRDDVERLVKVLEG